MRSLHAGLPPLHSENVDLYRNAKLSKMGLFTNFLYTFTINCATTGTRKKPIEYMFCFIYSQRCIIIISLCKMCGFIGSVFKKIFLITLPLLFKKWVG